MTNPTENARRWRCLVAYDGTTFSGWQSQPDGNAVQDHLERRLAFVLGAAVRVHGSGRTDAGVHARGQVFHFDAPWRHGPEKLLAALRAGGVAGLPPTIQVREARLAPPGFHARFSAVGKTYHYELVHGGWADPFAVRFTHSVPRPLDLSAMERAAEVLRGRQDFRAFSAFSGVERTDTVRALAQLELIASSRGRLRIVAEADGFLYKMVRSLVGALIAAGVGKLTADDLRDILASRERTARVETAPAQGLCLWRVRYPAPSALKRRAALASGEHPAEDSADAE